MYKLSLSIFAICMFASCKPTAYLGSYGQNNQTQVVLSQSNFKVLGSFKGVVTEKRKRMSIKDYEGLISRAKSNLLESAKASGIILEGSRRLVNVCFDLTVNRKMITATVSAEIVEFTK